MKTENYSKEEKNTKADNDQSKWRTVDYIWSFLFFIMIMMSISYFAVVETAKKLQMDVSRYEPSKFGV